MAEVYRAQTNPGHTTALAGASPETGIARGIEEAGAAVSRIGARVSERDRDNQNASAGLEFAKIASELDKAEIDGRDQAQPGAAGHSDGIAKVADERIGAALGNIKDPKLRNAYKTRYEDLRGNVFNRAYGWERAAHAEKLGADADETKRTLAAGQALNPDPLGLQVSLDTAGTMWDHMAVADDVKTKGKRDAQSTIAYAYANAIVDKDPSRILGSKETPSELTVLSKYLDDKQIASLRNAAQTEQARLDVIARRNATQYEAKRRDEIQSIGKRITSMSDDSVTDDEFDAAHADAVKFGDKTLELDIANWRDLRDVRKGTVGWAPDDWKGAIEKLEAKGEKITPGESLRLTHLRELRPAAEAKFNERPDEWANQAGDPIPQVDWSNPNAQQGQARAAWSKRIEAAGGKPALLTKQEVQEFQERMKPGIAGQLAVAQTIRATFGAGPDGIKALGQVDGGNAALKIMVGLPARTAADYRLGDEALKRNPKLVNAEVARTEFDGYVKGIPQELRGPLWDAARSIAAADLDRNGGGEPDDGAVKSAMDRAIHRAAGATGTAGGFVEWGESDTNRRLLWIPPDMDKGDAIKRLSRATPAQIIGANVGPNGTGPGGAPYYMGSDGKPVAYNERATELLKRGTLETVAPGVFRIVLADGGHVVNKLGQPWQFDIRKLGGR